ncbi:MAG: PAS-domain containing protein [Methyloceanibacter sp.]|nr:PAS-domain containing protein [Methyloceanibacter sp.]
MAKRQRKDASRAKTARMLLGLPAVASALLPLPLHAAASPTTGSLLDAPTLLMLGVNIGVITFAVATAIGCLRATQRASEASERAALEAERLRASECMLDTVLSAEPQMMLIWPGSGNPRMLAANLSPALGVPSDAALLLRFSDWLDEASSSALQDAMRNLGERGEAFNLMLSTRAQKHVEADGRATGGMISLKIRDLAGQRLEHATLMERHRQLDSEIASLRGLLAEAATRSSPAATKAGEASFRSFDRLATAFAVFDAEQRLDNFNQAFIELWQLDAEWLAGRPKDGEILDRLRLARRLPEKADFQDWKRSWLSAYGSNTEADEEWHLPDGRTLHVIADRPAGGGATCFYENVTERLALESRYNGLIDVQRETLDTLREGVSVFGPNGRLRLHNTAFASIWRLNPLRLESEPHIDEIVSWCRVLHDAPEEWERVKAAVTAIASERRPIESQLNRPDGSVIACAALPLPDGGTLLTFNDISDAKRAERALIERAEALEEADRIKTTFIQHVSYELRTPLTNIIGFTELLGSPFAGELNAKQREYLEDIGLSGRTLLSIIDDILDLATIDAGTFELKTSTVKVRALIEAAAHGLRERLKQGDVELEIAISPDIDTLEADGRRVTQILYNLLSNAIGSSPQGEKVVLSCSRDHSRLAFTVEDKGCGIPSEYQPFVFDRFESRSLGSRRRGAGLGLTLVKSLVELHGGTVALASEPGRGTWVRVLLPLQQAPRVHETSLADQSYRSSRAG